MSTIAGSFDETILNNIRVRADKMMFDEMIKLQFDPNMAVISGVKAAETAKVMVGESKNKDVDVEVMWQNYCDYTVEDDVSCQIGGTKSSTNLEQYSIDYKKVVNFSFDEGDFIDNEFMMDVAEGFLKADVELVEDFSQHAVTRVDSFAGVNQLGTNGKGVVVGTETYVDSAYWNAELVAYFKRVAIHNKYKNPIFISGDNLYEQIFVANAKSGDANGKGDMNLYSKLKMFFDPFNVDGVNSPDMKTYMIQTGALAMGNRYWNPLAPQRLKTFTRWAQESKFVPGLWYDVWYDDECTEVDNHVKHNFKFRLMADVWNNPAGCVQNNTGVLSFTCGTAP